MSPCRAWARWVSRSPVGDTNETIGVAVSYPSQLTSTEERAKLWQALRAMAVDLGGCSMIQRLALDSATPLRKAAAR